MKVNSTVFFYYIVLFLLVFSCSPSTPEMAVYLKIGRPLTWKSWESASEHINFTDSYLVSSSGMEQCRDISAGWDQDFSNRFAGKDFSRCKKEQPRAGIASHHLLVAPLLMTYYRNLASENPDIATFFILGPDHFHATGAKIAVGTESYVWGDKKVMINRPVAKELIDFLGITPDPQPFKREHSVFTHIPFIASFFPDATIVPVILDSNCSLEFCRKTAVFIRKQLDRKPLPFILLSIDFSHYLTSEETTIRDSRSVSLLMEMNPRYTRDITCDSPKSWFLFTSIFSHTNAFMDILYYTTNERFTGTPEKDITSYFFTLLRTIPD